jgi:quinol monooxygenase YgiN
MFIPLLIFAKDTKHMAIKEKKTGESYKSKSAMKKHEKSEGMKEMTKEYGKSGAAKKKASMSKSKK